MDYQDYVLDILRKECEKKKLVVAEALRFDNIGRWMVMNGTECLITLDFDFQPTGVHFSVNTEQLLISPRTNRVFWWKYNNVEDMNEEFARLAKVWHLLIKEATDAFAKEQAKAA